MIAGSEQLFTQLAKAAGKLDDPVVRQRLMRLHTLNEIAGARSRAMPSDGDTRLLVERDLVTLEPALRIELAVALGTGPVAGAFLVTGEPVSFCYAASMSETLWDISIDTVDGFRRRGHASRAVHFMIEWMRSHGREPVWASLSTNTASLATAAKLGFSACDEIYVFERPLDAA